MACMLARGNTGCGHLPKNESIRLEQVVSRRMLL